MEEPASEGLSSWLKEKCEQEGLSLRQAAAKSGLSHSTIAALINGGGASRNTIKKLARAFGGNGELTLVLEDKLLTLAGFRTERSGEGLTETMAGLLDKLSQLSDAQLKLVGHFADFLNQLEEH